MLIYVVFAAVVILAYMRFEVTRLIRERVVFTGGYSEDIKILQISDVHFKLLKIGRKRIRTVIEDEDPDLIVFTGDYIDSSDIMEDFADFAGYLVSGYPGYAVPGNHDIDSLREGDLFEIFSRMLCKKGVVLLGNESVMLEKNGLKYNLIGIDDLNKGDPDIKKAFSGKNPDASLNLVISHNPDVIFLLSDEKIDLLMCGHFHGGQIWMPFKLEFKVLRKERLPSQGITRGLHRIGDIPMYISRGLGNVCFPLRFMSIPEITIFEFRKG